MLPADLAPERFRGYPPEAKQLASNNIALLRRLPLAFVPLLLRELIVYDWKFPAERKDIDGQFAYLAALPAARLTKVMEPFSELHLNEALEKTDWVNTPAVFSEQLTAHLWATNQIDKFRAAAVEYVNQSSAPQNAVPLAVHRLGIAVIGKGVKENEYGLFRKLRPHGVYFTQVHHTDGLDVLVRAVVKRAAAHPSPYSHWYVDGGAAPAVPDGVVRISYGDLAPARRELQSRMQRSYQASVFDPEAFRTSLAQTRMEDLGLDRGRDAVLGRFELSLLTEGSGTQVFATTFVQWAAREAWRRAQPLTLMARFAPRQRESSMSELLGEAQRRPELDPQGSLVDADMGAYYTWLNQQRLPGSDEAKFLVWFEDHNEALAIGPGFERGARSERPVELQELVARIT